MELILSGASISEAHAAAISAIANCQTVVNGNLAIVTFEAENLHSIAEAIDELGLSLAVELHDINSKIPDFDAKRGPYRDEATDARADVLRVTEEDSDLSGAGLQPLAKVVVIESSRATDAARLYRRIQFGTARRDQHRYDRDNTITGSGWDFLNATRKRFGSLF